MTVAEKLQEVSFYAKEDKLLLYSEGMFWKAYQEAAYLFVKYVRNYQVNSNYIKKVQTDVYSLGFPKPSSSKILAGLDYEESDGRIVITLGTDNFLVSDYLQWRTEVVPQPVPARRPSGDALLAYKHTYDLVLYFYQINRNVSREYKFSLCEKIKEDLHEMLMSVYFANEETDIPSRLLRVKDAVRNLVSSKIRVRVLYDLKQISLKQFTHCAEMFVDLKEELNKWEKSLLCSL